MSEILVSFIIPAYNAAPYLKACIDSIYSLDLKGHDKEVIVVNDGSTDDTMEVLRLCKTRYPDLRLLSQENQGLSVSRNNAIDVAQGKYLCFVDADDELDCCCNVTMLLKVLEKGSIDVVGIDILQIEANGKRTPYRRYVPIYNKEYAPAREFMRGRNLFPCAWSYLYRREFIEAKGLRFMPGVFHEDEDFSVRTFAMASSFIALRIPLYVRMVREESITTTNNAEKQQRKLRDILKILSHLDEFAQEKEEYRECMRCKMDYIVVDMLRTMMRQSHGKGFEKEMIMALRRMKRFPLSWRWNIKYALFNIYTRLKYIYLICNLVLLYQYIM